MKLKIKGRDMKKNFLIMNIIILLLCVCAFTFLCVRVASFGGIWLDNKIVENIGKIQSKPFTDFVKIFTNLGSAIWCSLLVLVLVAVVWIIMGKKSALVLTIGYLLTAIFSLVVKLVVKRARPIGSLIEETGYSFPSAHAMLSLFLFGIFAFLICNLLSKKWQKIILCVVFGILAICVSATRLYLGVHYLSDVLAGWCICLPVLSFSLSVAQNYKVKTGQNQ